MSGADLRAGRGGPARAAALALVISFCAGAAAGAWAADRPGADPEPALGARIYREGVLPSGRPLSGTAQAGTERVGPDAACAGCHRRSGYGTSEGPMRIPPLTGPALFGWREVKPPAPLVAPPGMTPANAAVAAQAMKLAARKARVAAQAGTVRRPPYDEASLARALREGVDPTGRPLAPGMPRYALGDDDLRALVAHLQTLSAGPSPGVTGEELHLATVIQPGVEPARRRAMLDVLQAFVADKNAGTRSEARRREAGTERMYRAWRRWVLHVWELGGPSDGWEGQLQALYDRQPVFALVGGLGTASWGPIHAWSERVGVPCLFPQVDLPVLSETGFYTIYLSRGIALEAEALAKWLVERGAGGRLTQVWRRDEERGATAAAALRAALRASAKASLDDRVVEGPATRAFFEHLAAESAGRTVVVWLPGADLAEAGPLVAPGAGLEAVYLSATLSGAEGQALAAAAGERVRLVLPLDLPRARAARLIRVKRWLHDRGLPLSDEKVQANAFFAVSVVADVVSHMGELFSRDYLVERVEHMVGNTVTPSPYAHVSLGPGQRYASKGSYIVKAGAGPSELEPLSGWITP